MNICSSIAIHFLMAIILVMYPTIAHADAFIPTMISANLLWLFTLPLVVAFEGWFMSRWQWNKPYKNALRGNLWSMLAALPLGLALSILGGYLSSKDAQSTLAFIPKSTRYLLSQTFLYGQLPAPSYGFIDGFGSAGIFLAGLLFVGICWFLTFGVEGYYYGKKNPLLPRGTIYGFTAIVNLVSYSILMSLWVPYSYVAASSGQNTELQFCSHANTWSSRCPDILVKFPEIKEKRLNECYHLGIQEDHCLKGSN